MALVPVRPMPPDEDLHVERSAHALFKVLDTNVDGKITEPELRNVRTALVDGSLGRSELHWPTF